VSDQVPVELSSSAAEGRGSPTRSCGKDDGGAQMALRSPLRHVFELGFYDRNKMPKAGYR
jgi:hypothetical protein